MLGFWSDKVVFRMKMFLLCKLISSMGWILWMRCENTESPNIGISRLWNTIFQGWFYLQVVIEITTCKPLAQFLTATCTPTYIQLPECAQNDLSPYK